MNTAASPERFDVLYLLNNLAIGGSECKTVRAANGLVQRGMKVGMVCLNRPDTLLGTLDRRVQVWFLDRAGKFSLTAVAQLRKIVARTQAQTLIAVNLYPALYVAAAAALLPRRRRPRTVCLINTSTDGRFEWRLRRWLYKCVLHTFDRIVHGCEANRRLWAAPGSRAWRRSNVVYNGIDVNEFEPAAADYSAERVRASFGIDSRRFVVGTVGRLVTWKNQRVLVETLARLRWSGMDAHLLFVGDGPMRAPLAQLAERLDVRGRVTFAGAVSDVRPALAAMDVFVLPSVCIETFSNAVLEAMAMGKPVIQSEIGGAAEMLEHGVQGFIVPPQELGARLPALLAQLYADSRRRLAMGAAARARVNARFSITKFLDDHLALIQTGTQDRAHAQ